MKKKRKEVFQFHCELARSFTSSVSSTQNEPYNAFVPTMRTVKLNQVEILI